MDKSLEGSCGKNDSRTMKKRFAAASSKLGAASGTNKEKYIGLGDQSDKPWQSNLTQVSKLQPVHVMKRKFQKTAEVNQKTPPVYNLRSSVQKTDVSKDRPSYRLRSKVQKTEDQNASTSTTQKRKPLKKDSSKDSSVDIQNNRILKTSVAPPSTIKATKSLTTSMASLGMKNQPLTSQQQPYLHEPVYHIRWEGCDRENGPSGQNCVICHKDLSGVEEDEDSDYNDDYQYEDDDDDDEYEYFDDLTPTLLPAVDILPCGHAYHTECMQQGTSEEHLNDPQCVLCSRMA